MILLLFFLNPAQEFKVAKGLFDDEMFELAEKELKNFILNYKDNEYAKEAAVLYLKAMYEQKKYENLIVESNRLIKDYPEKKDDILLLKGKSEIKLKKYNEAERTFSNISDRKKRYTYLGDMFYENGEYKNAIIYYQKLDDDYAYFSIGWCYYKLGRLDDALKYFKMVNDKRYKEEADYLSSKIILYKTGKENDLLQYTKNYPKGRFKPNVYITLGEYYEEKNFQVSRNYYKKVIDEKLDFMDYAQYRIGLLFFKKELFDSSLYYFNLVEPSSKYFGECLYNIARINSIKGENKIAIKLFNEVIKDYPELRDQCYFRIGEIKEKEGNIEEAIDNFKKVKGEIKNGANIQIGNIFLKKGEFDSALYYFSEFEDEKSLFLKGITYYKMKNYDEVIRVCENILKTGKDKDILIKTKLLLGDTYFEKKDYKNGIDYYSDVLKYGDETYKPYALEGLGWAYVGIKDYKNAFNYLDKLSSEYPDFQGKSEIYLTMGDIAYSMKDYGRALEYYDKVKGGNEPEGIYKKGLVLFDKGDYGEAIKSFIELRKRYPLYEKSDEALYLISLSYRNAGDINSSISNLRELLTLTIPKEIKAKSLLLIADNFFDLGKYDSSMFYYDRYTYIFSKPEKGMIPGIRGIAYSVYKMKGEKEFENIVENYLGKYKDTPIYEELSIMFAELYNNIGNLKKGAVLLENIQKPEAKIILSSIYKKTNDEEKMIKVLNELLNIEGTKEFASTELSEYYFFRKRDYEKAIEYSKLLDKPKTNFIYFISLIEKGEDVKENLEGKNLGCYKELLQGIILLRKGDTTGMKFIDNVMNNDSTAPAGLYEKARYYSVKGEDDEARSILLKIKYLYPDSEYFSPGMIMLSKILIKKGNKKDAIKILEEVIGRKDGYEKEARFILNSIR
uniref:Tetratricopeptide repeat protein n=1 Tax=candidate division WOR-3 bacterium TaxID=2052148 RepID=A0A7C4UC16_UNCW3